MLHAGRNELRALGACFERFAREIVVVSAATASLLLMKYHPAGSRWLTNALYYGALPLAVIVLILRRNPLDFGLRRGNARLGAAHAAAGCIAAAAIVLAGSLMPSVRDFYARGRQSLAPYIAERVVIIASLEFFFRGFLLFGLARRFGAAAIAIQMMPFAIRHVGKPEAEAFGCILSGLYLGYVSYRSNAVWPAFVIHLFANVLNAVVHAL